MNRRCTQKSSDNDDADYVCVCGVCFLPIYSVSSSLDGRISRAHTGGRSHIISHSLSFCGACLNFFREKDSAIPFPRRP